MDSNGGFQSGDGLRATCMTISDIETAHPLWLKAQRGIPPGKMPEFEVNLKEHRVKEKNIQLKSHLLLRRLRTPIGKRKDNPLSQ